MDNLRPKWEQRALREVGWALLLLVIALVQTALFPAFWQVHSNLVLVAMVGWTLLRGLQAGGRWALYGGLALGILSPLPFGAHLLGLTLVAVGVAFATEGLGRDNLLLLLLCVVGGSLVQGLVLAGAMQLGGRSVVWLLYPFTIILPEVLANVVVAIPIYLVLRWLRGRERR